jgi:hypothetical protein
MRANLDFFLKGVRNQRMTVDMWVNKILRFDRERSSLAMTNKVEFRIGGVLAASCRLARPGLDQSSRKRR